MKQFITAAAEADAPDEEIGKIEFEIDGVMCTAFRPTDGQLAIFMAATSKNSSTEESVAGIINFLSSVLDEQSNSYVVSRLMDRRDKFGLPQANDVLRWLIGEWSARPTESPSGSTPSPESTGQPSTETTPALT